MRAIPFAPGVDCHQAVEAGNVVLLPNAGLPLAEEDWEVLRGIRETGSYHKNVAYKPCFDKLSGLDRMPAATRERTHSILRRFSESAIELAARLLPRYQATWRVDYASLRPVEEAGRKLPLKKRNDLLHTDAFPTRPTSGGLILRVFYNFHPSKSRVWLTSDPFASIAPRYAADAGLEAIAARGFFLRILSRRSAYDEFMLAFHDYLKRNTDFQTNCPKYRLEFQPGSAWIVFTDVVPHAVEAGQFAVDQTLIVPRESLASPEQAPISILEKMAGCSLA